ncbi:Coenzyme F420 hydrogenase/dehydrogenase, beta subunit C-terminal domain [Zunongwangia sp. SCSIO 43204]|uniref:Coenzyme F420 hydrogenase/dehydrogenase, beta subunit C-terminal domain n=1 Tax=Zunongwangia sp. SCSIO 43204 TaxID=2779359 RepID=UPI001CA93BD9|nr:Coenzyme F420 hydrogenase/dehydrogenase, beta subunit C-terminal domain [Zunongwangia sp. SCSIO 43204]UAB84833.1 Coenzyme F420 hydrogenase/dehydrogenase, beta subunit C-terminal domain [Zunongwangia sp. SCSIO 43204]
MSEAVELYKTVIANDLCIGCGACALVKDSPFYINKDKYGNIVANADKKNLENSSAKVLGVCPFSGKSKNEDELGEMFFPENRIEDKHLGRFLKTYAGHVVNDDIRKIASSGGIGKWFAHSLLRNNKVDHYIQVTENNSGNANEDLFKYDIFSDPESVIHGSTSAYYPTTLIEVVQKIRNIEGTFAITGVPCFIKTLRLLALKDIDLKKKIKFTVGIVCGGMKSANQAKMISWQLGVHPDNLTKINFRGKNYGETPATTKIYQVWSDRDDQVREKNSGDIFGADYGMGFFKPKACDFCDDVVGETADISIGDVWLPNYRFDTKGYSLIIVRNKELYNMLLEFESKGEIVLENLDPLDAIKSQQGGFRHRRDALSYRLLKRKNKGEWYPEKRVKPGEFEIEKKRKKIYDLREIMGDASHEIFLEALEKDDYGIFYTKISKYIKKYITAYHGVYVVRFYNKVKRRLNLIFNQ